MSVWAVSMVRDEIDVIEACVRHLLAEGVERILVADHNSADGTMDVLRTFDEVEIKAVRPEWAGIYPQAEVVNELVQEAGDRGADWVLPFDPDEVWFAPSGERLADELGRLDRHVEMVEATVHEHWPREDDPPGHPFRSIGWRATGVWAWNKVAVRPRSDVEVSIGNHQAHFRRRRVGVDRQALQMRHFPNRSFEQAVAKYRWKATAHPWWQGDPTALDDPEAAKAWWHHICHQDGLVYDPAPLRT